MSVLWAKRGWITPGSPTVRLLERYGASDAWDFVDSSYLRAGRVTTEPGLTVTRASSGYAETSDGRLVEFGSGVLRRTNKGVLVEGARTNLLLRSQAFDDAYWTKSNSTVTANAATAPDGTLTADLLYPNTTGSDRRVIRSVSGLTPATNYTGSAYIKAAGKNFAYMLVSQASTINDVVWFNLSNGTVGTTGSSAVSARIEALTNGWYRCSVTGPADGSDFFSVNVADANGNTSVAASGTDGIFIWGAQLEAAIFASSYIKTEGSTVTRAADQVTASLSGVAYPASLYAEFVRNGDTGAAEGVFQVDASSRAQRANINVSSTDTLSVTARGGTNDGDAAVTGAISVGAITKGAGRIEVDNVQAARVGTLATADTTASVPTSSPDTVRFGDFSSSATYGFIYFRRAAIIPLALTDAQLQEITT